MEKLFFVKLLIILSIICMILLLGNKINEQFDSFFPAPVRLNVETTNTKDRLILKWSKSGTNILNYFIVLFINNDGPFIITLPNLDINNNTNFSYEYLDVKMNVDYKFAVLAYNSKFLLSKVDKFTKVKLTPPGLQIEYVKDYNSKITCNQDGTFSVHNSKNCKQEIDIVHAQTIDKNGNTVNLNYENHDELMRNLKYSPKLNFNF